MAMAIARQPSWNLRTKIEKKKKTSQTTGLTSPTTSKQEPDSQYVDAG